MSSLDAIRSVSSSQLSAILRIQELSSAIAQNSLRLTTLKRINSAKDDPSGVIQAAILQQELAAAEQVSSGITRANALLSTADSAMEEVLTNLNQARTLVLQAAGGTLDAEEIAANQIQVDSILQAVDSLSRTQFAGQRLLDGTSSYRTTGADPTEVLDVDVLDKQTSDDITISINVTQQAAQASDSYTDGTLASDTTLVVTGSNGTTTLSLSSGATTQDIADAFNEVTYLTGVTATRIDASQVDFASVGYGSAATIEIEATAGTFDTSGGGSAEGTDAIATINGQSVTGAGSTFYYYGNQVSLVIEAATSATGALDAFVVSGDGLRFVIGTSPSATASIGLPKLTTTSLGGVTGNLYSIRSGGANTLTGGNAVEALEIIDDAIDEVTRGRAIVGSFQTYTLDSADNVLSSTIENTSAALSAVEDADVALETALLANNQLMQQAAYQALSISAMQYDSVLTILQSLASRF